MNIVVNFIEIPPLSRDCVTRNKG